MYQSASFKVYNASAGSGKTFTLVKEYLKVLLQSEDKFNFQKVLAITFTNKAAAEMKERVLHNLQEFSEGKQTDIYPKIIEETSLDELTIKNRSKKILKAILQNYSAFSITTIDSFTHKIIKSFAYDLGLSPNFEVELDVDTFLSQAVDLLISKIGIEEDITKVLINFSLEKVNDDKSWDISRDLNEFAKISLNEDDIPHFKALENKTLNDFIALKNNLIKHQIQNKTDLQEIGAKSLALISSEGLEYGNFFRSIFPNFLSDLSTFSLKFDYLKRSETIEKAIANHQFYTKSAKNEIISSIENILPELIRLFRESQQVYRQYLLNKLALKSITPLATLTKVNTELKSIKEENNIMLISEFNQLISENIKDQPAPFIYERIGQKFMHYFIDEMQDTSVLQWQNLVPLIGNALSQEKSNLLVVGDGKQAIYRWRGGKAEQFINLGSLEDKSSKGNPFQNVKKEVKELETNYRSYSEIIQFNNQFFQHTSGYFQNKTYKQLFIDGNKQRETTKKGGYISINFLAKEDTKEENDLKYAKKVLEIIRNLDSNFSGNEICVLVRKKENAITVANYLSENEIKIVSSETLLLQNSEKVNFIIDLLQIIQHPNDKETLLDVLYFLYNYLKLETGQHLFFEQLINQKNEYLFKELSVYGITFELKTFYQLPFYEKIEEIIRNFNLMPTSDAYLQFFLDVVFDNQRKGTSIQEFLDFWEQKKYSLSIVAQESTDAVQIMTIHKSKGLEFPIVIFPYDIDFYYQKDPKAWLGDLPTNSFGDFDELLISSSKDIKYVNDSGAEIYQRQREELELDNFNLLYVALTRPIEQLYIVAENRINAKGDANTNYSSGVFIEYLKEKKYWNDERLSYSFGDNKRVNKVKKKVSATEIQKQFISTSWQEHNIYMLANSSKLWDTTRGKAIEFGILIHEMMAKINTDKDVEKVVSQYIQQGFIDKEKSVAIGKKIREIVTHPKLSNYFSDDVTIFNERELLAEDKQIVIPDRLVFNDKNEVTIIDYKTGKPLEEHHIQLLKYEQVLQLMNFKVIKKLLIYINDIITVEEI